MTAEEDRAEVGKVDRVFANGCEARPSERNFPDTTERLAA